MRCKRLPLSRTLGWKRLDITHRSSNKQLTSSWFRVSDCLRSELRGREHGRRSVCSAGIVSSRRFLIPHIAPDEMVAECGVSQRSAVCGSNLLDFLKRSCRRRERFGRGGSSGMLRFRTPQACIHPLCRSSLTSLVASFSTYQIFAFSDSQGTRVSSDPF